MQNLPAEEYLNEKVRVVFEPMISKMLLEKPDEPVNLTYPFDFKLDTLYDRFSCKIFRKK